MRSVNFFISFGSFISIFFFFVPLSFARNGNDSFTLEDLSKSFQDIYAFYERKMSHPESISLCHKTIGSVCIYPYHEKTLSTISNETADCVDEFGNTPLMMAIATGNYALVKKILGYHPDLKRLVGPFHRPYTFFLGRFARLNQCANRDEQLEEVLTILLEDNCEAIHIRSLGGVSLRDEVLLCPEVALTIYKTADKCCPGAIDFRDLLDPLKILEDFVACEEYSPSFHAACKSSISMLKDSSVNFLSEIIEFARQKIEIN